MCIFYILYIYIYIYIYMYVCTQVSFEKSATWNIFHYPLNMFHLKYALLKVVGVPYVLKDPEDVRPGYCGPGGEFQGVSVQIYKVEDFF